MSQTPVSVYTVTMASAGTLTASAVIDVNYNNAYLVVPTMTSGSNIHIQVSDDGTTYRRLMEDRRGTYTKTITMASGGTLTGSLDLEEGMENPFIVTPSFASAADIYLHGSHDGATFSRLTHTPINSATVAVIDYQIKSGTSARMHPMPEGVRYIKVEVSTGVTQIAHSFTVVGTKQGVFDYVVPSFVTNRMVPIPLDAKFVKIETTATVDNGATFKIICSD